MFAAKKNGPPKMDGDCLFAARRLELPPSKSLLLRLQRCSSCCCYTGSSSIVSSQPLPRSDSSCGMDPRIGQRPLAIYSAPHSEGGSNVASSAEKIMQQQQQRVLPRQQRSIRAQHATSNYDRHFDAAAACLPAVPFSRTAPSPTTAAAVFVLVVFVIIIVVCGTRLVRSRCGCAPAASRVYNSPHSILCCACVCCLFMCFSLRSERSRAVDAELYVGPHLRGCILSIVATLLVDAQPHWTTHSPIVLVRCCRGERVCSSLSPFAEVRAAAATCVHPPWTRTTPLLRSFLLRATTVVSHTKKHPNSCCTLLTPTNIARTHAPLPVHSCRFHINRSIVSCV
jgi:hypothetical protein